MRSILNIASEQTPGRSVFFAFAAALPLLGGAVMVPLTTAELASERPLPLATSLLVALDAEAHALEATAHVTLATRGASRFEFELLEALEIVAVELGGRALEIVRVEEDSNEAGASQESEGEISEPKVATYSVALGSDAEQIVSVRYRGVLKYDWAASEKAGEIHNFDVQSHIGPEGVFLSGGVPWYPRQPIGDDVTRDNLPLIDFEVTVAPSSGLLLVASGNRVGDLGPRRRGVAETWRTPFPIPNLTLVGGPHEAHHRQFEDVGVYAHLRPASRDHADMILEAMASYLELYEPLLGPFPFREMTLVENFFSSGFAFPAFTLIDSVVVNMGERALRPGYLDHEVLHNWWGNGVLGAPNEGVWSETLASYGANLMRPVLEGREEDAVRQRRSIIEGLSRLPESGRKPLSSFGLNDGASHFIGYQKGSLVFWQLGREIGRDTLWYGLRTLATARQGRFTGWQEIESSIERTSGRSLDRFFDYWVHSAELPNLSPIRATWRRVQGTPAPEPGALTLELSEAVPLDIAAFEIELHFVGEEEVRPGGTNERELRTIALERGRRSVQLMVSSVPSRVLIDPRFATMRRISPKLWTPTISGLVPPLGLSILRTVEEEPTLEEGYEVVAEALRERFEESGQVDELRLRLGETSELPSGHLLVLGDAIRHSPRVQQLLASVGLEVDPRQPGFTLEGTSHGDVGASILACVSRPQELGAQICAYWGNSPEALANAHLLTFYGADSLLLFENGAPTLRRRFEAVEQIEVEQIH